jgi:hypothetical protein
MAISREMLRTGAPARATTTAKTVVVLQGSLYFQNTAIALFQWRSKSNTVRIVPVEKFVRTRNLVGTTKPQFDQFE